MPAFVTGFSSNNPVSRGIRRGICCRCLPDACSASPIKLGEMRKTKLYQSCHASRPRSCRRSHRRRGITSACAEQTAANTSPHSSTTDHLRVCGADSSGVVRSRDHLRVCGADARVHQRQHGQVGSPPRVRSRRWWHARLSLRTGITSACAEQTSAGFRRSGRCWDHLRVCGADTNAATANMPGRGLPPRVRSRRGWCWCGFCVCGITSACAEQTCGVPVQCLPARDYLRVCGADWSMVRSETDPGGLPPRVRSRRIGLRPARAGRGITSACAEQTSLMDSTLMLCKDYLRVCGADSCTCDLQRVVLGLPPRVRSRLRPVQLS